MSVLLPDGLTSTPITADDLPALADLLAAAEEVDRTGEHHSADDLAEEWLNDLVDLPRDSLLVRAGEELVAFGTVVAPPTFRDALAVYLDGRVHPAWRGRGVGRALLTWQLERGGQVHAERHPGAPARLTASLPTTMPDAEALARRAGLTPTRWFHTMHRPLSDLPAGREVPGIELVAFDPARDDEVRRAHNRAFTEHYGSSERDEASWQTMFTGSASFRPDLSVLALDDGAVVAYALAYVWESDTAATGRREAHYGQIGVVPEHRGRGLSKAVIAEALHRAAVRDCQLAGLDVDSENGSGALGLYEGLGFVTVHTRTSWVRELPAT
ncbi:GNAT family N-acetyltransferase [Modestobacter sp. VKM Ac-2986]|uniref:GNAT family N-acetyltransferase n=1 Tax=Modestobacter sp. VKM Ac-2986 TaxID=3004140 RepID=UPI0022ABA607|nr:GNAT family N-acetyltransferase [Modestobacter sp. VKM Ac-2986]MCZ2830476.1 GNAT family N-acetyltransferase [Modestobacter sp. VKM Ac-2986]